MPTKGSTLAQIAVFAIIMSIIWLVKCTVEYINNYKAFSTAREGTCTTYNSSYRATVNCNCASGKTQCTSSYPCLAIYVILDESGPPRSPEYPDKITRGHKEDYDDYDLPLPDPQDKVATQLFEDEDVLSNGNLCTVKPSCARDRVVNTEEVKKYDYEYGSIGTTFKCYFPPHAPEKVILFVTPWSRVKHWFIWPPVIIILAFCSLGYVKFKRPDDDILTILGMRQCLNSVCKPKEESHPNAGTQQELKKLTPRLSGHYPPQQNLENQVSWNGNQNGDPEYLPHAYGPVPSHYPPQQNLENQASWNGNQNGDPEYLPHAYGPVPSHYPPQQNLENQASRNGSQDGDPEYFPHAYGPVPNAPPPAYNTINK